MQEELRSCKAESAAELSSFREKLEKAQKADERATAATDIGEVDSSASMSAEIAKLQHELQASRAGGTAELEAW